MVKLCTGYRAALTGMAPAAWEGEMDGAALTFLAAVAAPFLTGLAWLAWSHPKAFDKLASPLMFITFVVFWTVLAHDVGLARGFEAVKPLIPADKMDQWTAEIADVRVAYFWPMTGLASFFFYLAFLNFGLPFLKLASNHEHKGE